MKPPWTKTEPQPLADEITGQLQSSLGWKRAQGYYDDWPEYERFKRGRQWPEPTPDTRLYPRPVINIFETIIDQKVSAVLSEEPKIVFLPREGAVGGAGAETADQEAARLFTRVGDYTAEEVGNDELNEAVVETSCLLGTGFSYWWWDPGRRGGEPRRGTAYEGNIVGEEIDPADIHFGNPRERDLQKQPWIIITTRTPLTAFRELYQEPAGRLGLDINTIRTSRPEVSRRMYDAEKNELTATEYVDEIRRFRKVYNREAGRVEVWYEVVADGKLVRAERPLFRRSNLYPVAMFPWKRVRNCILGEGEGPNAIEAQKALNRLLAMTIWNGYVTAWAKLRYKKDARIDVTRLNNDPSRPIEDGSPLGSGWGVDYLAPPPVPAYVQGLFAALPDMVKTEAGVHEALVGQAPGGELNAQAIVMLQKAAGVRISRISRNFRRYLRDVGRIWEAFWKEFYTERRLIRITEDAGREFFWFRGTDYADYDFDVRVEATPSTAYGEAVTLSELKEHLEKGRITFGQYLDNVPRSIFPMADQLREELGAVPEGGEGSGIV